ncbi:MAG: hypothetical protein ABIG60_01310 [Patescibacteria group bacterium]
MNSRRFLGILIIILAILIIIGIVYIIFFYDFTTDELSVEETSEEVSYIPATESALLPAEEVPETKITPKISDEEITREDLKRMAASFTERFGSYSNHSNYGNILDLKIFMSSNMKTWADNYISTTRQQVKFTDIYYGITTKAVQTEINNFSDDDMQAEILVKTQRRESTGSMSNAATFYQDIIIRFIKEAGAWKVDSAFWQDK